MAESKGPQKKSFSPRCNMYARLRSYENCSLSSSPIHPSRECKSVMGVQCSNMNLSGLWFWVGDAR